MLEGEVGTNFVFGKVGIDAIFGNAGNDIIRGNDDSDFLNGGEGDDRLEGGDGFDVLEGGTGDDLLVGGEGLDTFVFSDEFAINPETSQNELVSVGNDRVLDFDGIDRFDFNFKENSVTDIAQVGDDVLFQFAKGSLTVEDATVLAFEGPDTISGPDNVFNLLNAAIDEFSLNNENDLAEPDVEILTDSNGNKTIIGTAGSDFLAGDTGDDRFGRGGWR